MVPLIKWVYLVTLAVWVGSVIFFSFVVAPTIFKTLKPEDAAQLQRALFPKYYLVGIICAAIGIACVGVLLGGNLLPTAVGVVSLLLLAGSGAADLWMRQGVVPQMTAVREQVAAARAAGQELNPQLEADWKAMHRLSVRVNGAVLLCLLALFYALVHARLL